MKRVDLSDHSGEKTLAIMAAGSSSRYRTLKQIAPVGPAGESLLDFTVFDAARAGFEQLLLIVRQEILSIFQETVAKRLERVIDVRFVLQDDPPDGLRTPPRVKPWGTAHAVLAAGSLCDDHLAVVNADDYYGQRTFQSLRRAIGRHDSQISIVTHRLDRTLSENGSVSRGVCDVDPQHFLTDINETHGIHRSGALLVGQRSESNVSLTGEEPVVMNTWYFTRGGLDLMRTEWESFIGGSQRNSATAEFGLAPVVKVLVDRGSVRVGVEETPDDCFGLTNPGDEEGVVARLSEMHESGLYPSPLWSHA